MSMDHGKAELSNVDSRLDVPDAAPIELRGRGFLRRIVNTPKGRIGLSITVVYILLGVTGPFLAPIDIYTQDLAGALNPPSSEHWFGTDHLGRDIFSRILAGAPVSLGIGLFGVAIAFIIGAPIGILSSYAGGKVDFTVMRGIDVLLSFPDILLAMAVVAILGPSTRNVILAVGIVGIPIFARTARGVTLSVKEQPYIEASHALACSGRRVVLRHVLPNIAGSLIILSSLLFATTLLTASALGFLGLGAQPPEPEWGAMLGDGRGYIRTHGYVATFPGIFLAVGALGFNLLGESLRGLLDTSNG